MFLEHLSSLRQSHILGQPAKVAKGLALLLADGVEEQYSAAYLYVDESQCPVARTDFGLLHRKASTFFNYAQYSSAKLHVACYGAVELNQTFLSSVHQHGSTDRARYTSCSRCGMKAGIRLKTEPHVWSFFPDRLK